MPAIDFNRNPKKKTKKKVPKAKKFTPPASSRSDAAQRTARYRQPDTTTHDAATHTPEDRKTAKDFKAKERKQEARGKTIPHDSQKRHRSNTRVVKKFDMQKAQRKRLVKARVIGDRPYSDKERTEVDRFKGTKEFKAAQFAGTRSKTTYNLSKGKSIQKAKRRYASLAPTDSFPNKALRAPTHAANAVLEVLARPSHAIAAAVDEDIKDIKRGKIPVGRGSSKRAVNAIKGKDKTNFSDVLKNNGVKNKWVRGIVGTTLDIGTDPVTYGTLGFGSVAKKAGEKAGQAAAKQADKTVKKAGGDHAARESARQQAYDSAYHKASKGKTNRKGVQVGFRVPISGQKVSTSGRASAAAGTALKHAPGRKTTRKVGDKILPHIAPDYRKKGEPELEHTTRRNAERKRKASKGIAAREEHDVTEAIELETMKGHRPRTRWGKRHKAKKAAAARDELTRSVERTPVNIPALRVESRLTASEKLRRRKVKVKTKVSRAKVREANAKGKVSVAAPRAATDDHVTRVRALDWATRERRVEDALSAELKPIEARLSNTQEFRPRSNGKEMMFGGKARIVHESGRGSIDSKGKLHTWAEKDTHLDRGFGDPRKGADFVIRPNGEISVHAGGLNMSDKEIVARAIAQDPRLKPPKEWNTKPDAPAPSTATGRRTRTSMTRWSASARTTRGSRSRSAPSTRSTSASARRPRPCTTRSLSLASRRPSPSRRPVTSRPSRAPRISVRHRTNSRS